MREETASIKELARTAAAMRSMSGPELLEQAHRVVDGAARGMAPAYWRECFQQAMENVSVARSMGESETVSAVAGMSAIVCAACLIRTEEGGEQ
ncbi:MAG: hypothetical protein RJA36_1917 [Pseudomonadota bacterium]|jgi:hypothetical protein